MEDKSDIYFGKHSVLHRFNLAGFYLRKLLVKVNIFRLQFRIFRLQIIDVLCDYVLECLYLLDKVCRFCVLHSHNKLADQQRNLRNGFNSSHSGNLIKSK